MRLFLFQAPDPNNRLFINISVNFPSNGDNRLILYQVPQKFGVADLYNLDRDGVIEKISITNARYIDTYRISCIYRPPPLISASPPFQEGKSS